jgi:hypothetical protein
MKQICKANGRASQGPRRVVGVTEIALAYRYPERTPTLSDMARTVSTASRLLKFSNLDERIETENLAVLALAWKRQLVS